jgi:methanogenic corrinoid protein MtbC1
LRGLIPEIRQASPNPALKIMAGGALLTVFPEIALEIGADAVTHDARTAQTTALSLVSNEQYKRQLEMTLSNVN